MLLDIEPAKAVELIDSARHLYKETIVPAEFPESMHSPYQPEYDWLFIYERRIAAVLKTWLRSHRYDLIGEKGLLCEALSNAFCHGHRKDPHKPIMVRAVVGNQGLVVRIRDCGPGFDVADIYARYKKNKTYYVTAGNGLRRMAESTDFGIFYDTTGNSFHLIYFFPESRVSLSNLNSIAT